MGSACRIFYEPPPCWQDHHRHFFGLANAEWNSKNLTAALPAEYVITWRGILLHQTQHNDPAVIMINAILINSAGGHGWLWRPSWPSAGSSWPVLMHFLFIINACGTWSNGASCHPACGPLAENAVVHWSTRRQLVVVVEVLVQDFGSPSSASRFKSQSLVPSERVYDLIALTHPPADVISIACVAHWLFSCINGYSISV